ncbi:MAG: PhoU domain-containing protein [Ignisphaera sp.]|uniref:Phosphate uptake regulator PhoU n=1 Tax=Ignisphaera aggregans TaxID=334771 RepID=A0A832CRS5_9CREN
MRSYRRKVQRIGKSTFIVTLPSSWAKEVGLENKGEVLLEVLPDMSLRIYKALSSSGKELVAELKVDNNYNEHDIAREIIAYYISGISIIRIFYEGIHRSLVDKGINIARERLIGLEIIDEDLNVITLQIVVDPNLRDIESVVKRLKRIAMSMHRDIIRYFQGDVDQSILDSVIARDNLADKLYLLALRQLAQILHDPYEMGKKGFDHIEAMHMVMFIKSLERIADHAVNMAKTAKGIKTIPKELIDLYKETIDVFESMSDALIDMNKQKAMELVRQVEKLKIIDEEVRKKFSIDIELGHHLTRFLDIISRILARAIDTEEIIIDINATRTLRGFLIEAKQG